MSSLSRRDALKALGIASLLTSTIDTSIESHLMGFAAEQSRKGNKMVEIKL